MNDIINKKLKEVERYLLDNYEGCVEICGVDDEVNTIPAKRALDMVKDVLSYIEATA